MRSTMQNAPLLVSNIFRHGKMTHSESVVITVDAEGYQKATFNEVADRVGKLANALQRLGVNEGDRVGTLSWNNQRHLEAFLAVPSMGAVIHTLNIRLSGDQLAYVINHAEDRFIIVDSALIPLMASIRPHLSTVEAIIVAGEEDPNVLAGTLSYEGLIEDESTVFDWPLLDERAAAAMCYTSGTTGNPKGVVYSHRSTYLHTAAIQFASTFGLVERDRILIIVPMFHANAWGTPYGAWMAGSDIVLPQRFVMGERLAAIFNEHHPTIACGVPTIWNELLELKLPIDFSTVRGIVVGGAAVPESLIREFDEQTGVTLIQAWGMTESSPLGAFGSMPVHRSDDYADMHFKAKAGRILAGLEVRVVGEDGSTLVNDGHAVGEFEIRGPWVTGSYYKEEDSSSFHDGWLRTGDVGTLDRDGFMSVSDRAKDVIKSGGEWISSVELEKAVMAHPDVYEAAVISVPDPKWSERPLVGVVLKPGHIPNPTELVRSLVDVVPRWWLPEQWTFIDEVPKTSVGKFDKKAMRIALLAGDYTILRVELPNPSSQPQDCPE
jgi:fatty-acyl-CoA synthase